VCTRKSIKTVYRKVEEETQKKGEISISKGISKITTKKGGERNFVLTIM